MRVRLGLDRMTGKSRGFAFAEFSDPALAADAIRRFDGAELQGRRLRVNAAEDRPPRAPRFSPAPDLGGGQFASEFSPPPFRKNGGSRRGLRGKKRSLR